MFRKGLKCSFFFFQLGWNDCFIFFYLKRSKLSFIYKCDLKVQFSSRCGYGEFTSSLRTSQSLFSLYSRVPRNGTFSTNLGAYRTNWSYKGLWSKIQSHLLPREKFSKNIYSLHNGAKSLPLKKLQSLEKSFFSTKIGAITKRKDYWVKLTYFKNYWKKLLIVITLFRWEKYQKRVKLAYLNCFSKFFPQNTTLTDF